jgi:hypothetical protein
MAFVAVLDAPHPAGVVFDCILDIPFSVSDLRHHTR